VTDPGERPSPERLIVRRSARALLIDSDGRLVVFRRTKPGVPLYWTTPGGRVEEDDASTEAAMRRELWEELGAVAGGAAQVFLQTTVLSEDSVAVQHFFVTRLVSMDIAARTGPEFTDPAAGLYDVERIDLRGDGLAAINLRPPGLRDFILANTDALLAEAERLSPQGANAARPASPPAASA
jgi:8-oxo-dGTP pyrophosphatase MutT (NUDIX family)